MAKKNTAATKKTAATSKATAPKEVKMTPFQLALKSYLDEYASKDDLFAAKYANKDKTIAKCSAYIIGEAKKQKDSGNVVVLSDEVVYGMAVHYYEEDDVSLSSEKANVENASCEVATTGTVEEISKKVEISLF